MKTFVFVVSEDKRNVNVNKFIFVRRETGVYLVRRTNGARRKNLNREEEIRG